MAGCAFLGGFFLAAPEAPRLSVFFPLCLALLSTALVVRRRKKGWFIVAAACWSSLAGSLFFLHEYQQAVRREADFRRWIASPRSSQPLRWIGRVCDFAERYPKEKVRLTVEIEQVFSSDGEDAATHLLRGQHIFLYVEESEKLWRYGERFTLTSNVRQGKVFRNPSPPSFHTRETFRLLRGIYGYSAVENDRAMESLRGFTSRYDPLTPLFRWVDGKRQAFSQYLERHVPPTEGAFLQALTVGYRGFTEEWWRERTVRSGVQHLFAISGLHLVAVSTLSFVIVRFLLTRYFVRLFLRVPAPILSGTLTLPLVAVYALLSGFAAPTERAFIFFLFFVGALWSFREKDILTVLSVTASIVTITEPALAFSPSAILSFAAASAIPWIAVTLEKPENLSENSSRGVTTHLRRTVTLFFNTFWVSLCVQVLLYPFVMYFFFRFSWTGLIANVVLVPYVSIVVLPAALVLLGCFFVVEPLGYMVAAVVLWLVRGMMEAIAFFGALPSIVSWGLLGASSTWAAVAWTALYVALLGGIAHRLHSRRHPPLIAILLLLSLPSAYHLSLYLLERGKTSHLEATVMDVGSGSSLWIAFPSGTTMLVDGGGLPRSPVDMGQNVIIPTIIASGFRHIDYALLSHLHDDHAQVIASLLSSAFPLRHLVMPLCVPQTPLSFDIPLLAARQSIPLLSLAEARRRFASLPLGGAEVFILHPREEADHLCATLNDSSTVLMIRFGSTSLLAPGDIGITQMSRLLPEIMAHRRGELILIAPHHGRCASFRSETVERLDPRVVVISNDRRGRNAPCPRFLQWCHEKGNRCMVTADNGAVVLHSDGTSWKVKGVPVGREEHLRTPQETKKEE